MYALVFRTFIAAAIISVLGACSTEKASSPDRTASEQLLISAAADRAANNLDLQVVRGTKVFIDTEYFEGTDSKYALSAIRASLLRQGAAIVSDRKDAQAVVELRAGALSIDETNTLVGVPSFAIPIPLAGRFDTPEIALFKRTERKGVAKFAAHSYGVADGKLMHSTPPKFGYAHKRDWVVLLFISWKTSDLPSEKDDGVLEEW